MFASHALARAIAVREGPETDRSRSANAQRSRRHRRRSLFAVGVAGILCVGLAPASASSASGDDYSITPHSAGFVQAGPGDLFPNGVDDGLIALSTHSTGLTKLPFPIKVYGGSYSRIVVSSNGNVQFTNGSGSSQYFNDCLPSGNMNYPLIAPIWDDIVIAAQNSTNPKQGLFVRTTGSKPHRKFIINWNGLHFGTTNPIRAGVVFTEGSPSFAFQYLENDASEATVGVQRSSAGPDDQWSCNQAGAVYPDLKLVFAPQ